MEQGWLRCEVIQAFSSVARVKDGSGYNFGVPRRSKGRLNASNGGLWWWGGGGVAGNKKSPSVCFGDFLCDGL